MAVKNLASGAALGARLGGLAGPGGALVGGVGGALASGAYDLLTTSEEEKRRAHLAERIRELEMREAGLTPEEASIYRQSINAPAIEEAAAADARMQSALAMKGTGSGALMSKLQEDEAKKAAQLQKTEFGLMGADLQAKAEQERELDRLYDEQAGLAEDPTESMLAFADEVEYQVTGAAEEASLNEAMLGFLKGEGMDGTPEERKDLMGFISWMGGQ